MKLNLLFIPLCTACNKHILTQYRLVSLRSHSLEMIEKLLFKRLDNVIENKRLQRSQHGFR